MRVLPMLVYSRYRGRPLCASSQRMAVLSVVDCFEAAACCMGRRIRRTEPYPDCGSRDADVVRASKLEHVVQSIGALVRKSADGCGAAAIAAFQAIRCDTGMPSRVIRLSTEQATRASVVWLDRVRARRLRPMMVL